MQLQLMRENPESLDEAVRLACQWETIEVAQKTFQKERTAVAEALEPSERDRNTMALAAHRMRGPSDQGAEAGMPKASWPDLSGRRMLPPKGRAPMEACFVKGRLNAWQWIFLAPSMRPLMAIAIYDRRLFYQMERSFSPMQRDMVATSIARVL